MEHQRKTFIPLSQFWPLSGWSVGGSIEFIKKGQLVTEIFFPDNVDGKSKDL